MRIETNILASSTHRQCKYAVSPSKQLSEMIEMWRTHVAKYTSYQHNRHWVIFNTGS